MLWARTNARFRDEAVGEWAIPINRSPLNCDDAL